MCRAEPIARLHVSLEEIQAAMGWEDYHLFEFRLGETVYGIPDPDGDWGREVRNAKSMKLAALIARDVDRFLYVYDLGDNWQHLVTVEAVGPSDPEILY